MSIEQKSKFGFGYFFICVSNGTKLAHNDVILCHMTFSTVTRSTMTTMKSRKKMPSNMVYGS